MIKSLALAVVGLVAALLLYAATRPDTFRVERSVTIQAPPEKVFSLVNDFHQWERWSPWEKIDPAIQRRYSGAASGKGAVYEWSGNNEVGHGRLQPLESSAPRKAVLQIHFIKPLEPRNTVGFTLAAQGGATTVTQAMYGPSPFISKLMGLFFSMDKMVGEKYEQGLATLKAIAEK